VQHKELTGRIIGAAITVHKALGPGFLESVYEAALAGDFDLAGIQYERQKRIQIFYRDRQVGEHRLDFIVEQAIYVELKATQDLADVHCAVWFESGEARTWFNPKLCDHATDDKASGPRRSGSPNLCAS